MKHIAALSLAGTLLAACATPAADPAPEAPMASPVAPEADEARVNSTMKACSDRTTGLNRITKCIRFGNRLKCSPFPASCPA